jgi:tetratricopeptide (TPR) repeat protein
MQCFGPKIGRWFQMLAFIAVLSSYSNAAVGADFKSLVQQAFDRHQKGEFAEALPLLRRAYALKPGDYFVNLLLGIDSLRTGQAKTAVPYLKKASRLRPLEEYPLDYLGEANARQEIYGEAAEAYIKAVGVARGSAESAIAFVDFSLTRFASMTELMRSSRKGLAAQYRLRALALSEKDASRMSLLQRAADLDSSAPGIWSDLALAALAEGDRKAAEGYENRALQANQNDQIAWIVDAELAAQRSDWERAIMRLNAVAQHSPSLLNQAVKWWPQGLQPQPSAAIAGPVARFLSCVRDQKKSCDIGVRAETLSRSSATLYREQRWEQLAKLPAPQIGRTEAWFQRGIAFAKLEFCQRAIPSLERSLSKSAPDVYGMFLLSWCYSREAGRTAQTVAQSGSDEAPLNMMRGDVLLRLQAKPELALSEYQLALAKDPHDPAVLERLADAQFGAGIIDGARQSAQAALKVDPQRLAAKRTLAKIAMQERDYATALPYLQEISARNPQDLTMRIELAKACAQTGASDDALHNLAPVLAQGYPDEKGSLHYLLGTILKKMGQTAEADKAFATATQLSDAFQQKSYRDQDPDAQP